MVSKHTRNVDGMHDAPRCGALTHNGNPCCSPAVKGQKRCHVHGGKGAGGRGRAGAPRRGAYARAVLELDRTLNDAIRKIDAQIRRIERGDDLTGLGARLVEVRQDLRRLTQQKQPDLGEPRRNDGADLQTRSAAIVTRGNATDPGPQIEVIRDRARGAMLGLAIGNALGVTVKSFRRDSYRHITDMLGGGILDLRPGQWSGVTAMALALLDSLVVRRGLDETDFIERLLDWHRDGAYSCTGACTDIGGTTRIALECYQESGNPLAGSRNPDTAGSGSLVRLAPVAIRYWNDPDALRDVATRQSRVTHAAAEAVDACIVLAEVLGEAMKGTERRQALRPRPMPDAPFAEHIIQGSGKDKWRDDIASSAYVIHTLEAALWCVGTTTSFEDAVVLAANLGECSDGVAAATGQLAGAIYGLRSIPWHWLEPLAWRERIIEMTDALVEQGMPSRAKRR